MRRWLAAGLVLAGAAGAFGQDDSAAFAPKLPRGVVDVSQWQVVTGSFETETGRGSYLFYVNPTRSGLYQLMRYRVELRSAASSEERTRSSAERVVFIPRPGAREPMLCWEWTSGAVPAWREVVAGTGEYKLEMSVLIRVLAAHRAARAGVQ
jgi:hypothetical protein